MQARSWKLGLCAGVLMLAEIAGADERVSGPATPCAKLAGLVQARGAAISSAAPQLYERVVRDQSFCERDMATAPAYVPSADVRLCFAGYRCRPVERGEGRPD